MIYIFAHVCHILVLSSMFTRYELARLTSACVVGYGHKDTAGRMYAHQNAMRAFDLLALNESISRCVYFPFEITSFIQKYVKLLTNFNKTF